ncbi:MAG TPA: hypothetical protein DCS07_13570 [Bdellovibrionales bacterium]|nr:MAG: hypothetical protein A2Z97_05105 [Bdellovibrionales bacterium GWB1_52_6]OFZ04568.1 MAG: hypothetical protein A2X97_13180 [Bdellovibrionales bacterium GWA1_52_35]OFZ42947.1 MAG: hypothetical protein A2070_10340 [Bdellovibrionales bacterium GWC1_52_8]HAR43637.1 hypothetical protein [Bdellovibrionales bacterium]HCM39979.1 hypothetical protein [Bdellovibrionales bacterium]
MTDHVDPLLRKALKLLLLQLAAKYDKPSVHLDAILTEVIQELYDESKAQLDEKKNRLRLVNTS